MSKLCFLNVVLHISNTQTHQGYVINVLPLHTTTAVTSIGWPVSKTSGSTTNMHEALLINASQSTSQPTSQLIYTRESSSFSILHIFPNFMRPLLLTAFLHGVRSHVPRAAGFLLNLPLRISFPPLLALRTPRLSSSSGCTTADLLSYAFFNVSTTLMVLFVLPLIIFFSFVAPHFHLSFFIAISLLIFSGVLGTHFSSTYNCWSYHRLE